MSMRGRGVTAADHVEEEAERKRKFRGGRWWGRALERLSRWVAFRGGGEVVLLFFFILFLKLQFPSIEKNGETFE
jgi:hypothetical protein